MAKFKIGDPVELPYVFTGEDVVKIVVESVNDVTGVVNTVKVIKENGKVEVKDVTQIVVVAVGFFARIANFFAKLFGKKK